MPDVFTKAKRSEVMSRIRSRGNRDTELALVKLLRAHGIKGWRRHKEVRSLKSEEASSKPRSGVSAERRHSRIPGRRLRRSAETPLRSRGFKVKPDFVFQKLRTVIFVDGCFWHGCPRHATKPRHNAAFWRKKLAGNKTRDRLVTRTLRRAGWRVLRIWEHELSRLKAEGRMQNAESVRLVRRIRLALVRG